VNDAQHAALSDYIREMADRLLLRDWEFELRRESADEGARASISLNYNKNDASVVVCDRWFVRAPDEQRQTITHELLHAQTARLRRVMSRLNDEVGGEAIGYANAAYSEEEEIVVDTLARAIAPLLPLPPEVSDA
jgi:hypothetical protein